MRPPGEGPIDPRVFEALVEEYADRVYGIALRITGSPEEAQDATQDAFLSAFQHREQFRGESAVSTWLYRIAVNASLQRIRARRPSTSLEVREETAPIADWSQDLLRRAEQAELQEIVEHEISLLPEELRVALVLRDVEGFSTGEAAAILELSEPALKSRLHRARLQLRQQLADRFEGFEI